MLVASGRSGDHGRVSPSLAQARGELRPRGTPLEYWFVTLRTGDLAFLVDWIVRRGEGTAEVRVSLRLRGQGRVVRAGGASWRDGPGEVVIGGCTLTSSRATGELEDVRWELAHDPGPWLLDPAPVLATVLRPFDLRLVARPRARFTGTVTVGEEVFRVVDAEGTVVHYWGRRLPDSWVWVSADGVGDQAAAVEAALFRSRVWGLPGTGVDAGYVAVHDGSRTELVIAPAYGRMSVHGSETTFELDARSRAHHVHLTAHAGPDSYNDLGEGIHQALLGDLGVDGRGTCRGRAGLEIRGDLLRTPWTT